MKWYKRYPEFSRSPEVFHISPLAHLVYTVLCDLAAELDCEGVLAEKYVNDASFLARRLNIRLVTPEQIELLGATHDDVLLGHVTHEALLSRCVTQLCAVGLLRENRAKVGDQGVVYEIPGFTADNQKYISDGTLRQRKHRKESDNVTHAALPSVTVTHEALLSRQEENRREEKRKEKKQKKANALSPEKPTTSEQPSESSEKEKTDKREAVEVYKSLKTALEASYKQKRGEDYLFAHGKDGNALKRLIGHFKPEAILERWERGLGFQGFHQINSVAELYSKWNHLNAAEGALGAKPRSMYVASKISETMDYDYSVKTL